MKYDLSIQKEMKYDSRMAMVTITIASAVWQQTILLESLKFKEESCLWVCHNCNNFEFSILRYDLHIFLSRACRGGFVYCFGRSRCFDTTTYHYIPFDLNDLKIFEAFEVTWLSQKAQLRILKKVMAQSWFSHKC